MTNDRMIIMLRLEVCGQF